MNKISGLVILLAILVLGSFSNEPKKITVEKILEKCAVAMGGIKRINNFQTLRVYVNYPGHGAGIKTELSRPRKMRTTGSNDSYLMVNNGQEACLMEKSKGSKTFDKLRLIKKEEMPDLIAEPGFFMFYFFEFTAKYEGIKYLDGRKVYLLSVKMPFEVTMEYYIDCQSNLPVRTVAHVRMMGKPMIWSRDYFDFRPVAGILYPHSFYYRFGKRKKEKAEIIKVEINPVFPKDYFYVPKSLK